MPIDIHELVDQFGTAALAGNGAVFVGAGVSRAAGLPDWWGLLEPARQKADVPATLDDAPLVAEYIAESPQVGREALHELTLVGILDKDDGQTTEVHRLLAELPVTEYWTTNYDELIERARSNPQVLLDDDQVQGMSVSRVSVIKLHGSLTAGPPRKWTSSPVLTRSEFEQYELRHPRMWALLRASYVSRTILFLGFSFADPNVEVLQRLARQHGTNVGDRHLTVMRRPGRGDSDNELIERRLHELKVADLEKSGVQVCEIDSFDELPLILRSLVRRTRPKRLFISGSIEETSPDKQEFDGWCSRLALLLADQVGWEIASLAGPAGWNVTRDLAHMQVAADSYDPEKLVFHFRRKDGAAPPLEARWGTAVYSGMERLELVDHVQRECRALVAIRGGGRTKEELERARAAGVSVVPLAASGGAAREYWVEREHDLPQIGGQEADPSLWSQLNSQEPLVAVRAVISLLRQGMYDQAQTSQL